VRVAGAAAVLAEHEAGGVLAVEAGAQLALDEAAQGGRVLLELGATLLQGAEHAGAGVDHLLAGGGSGGGLLGLGVAGGGRQQRQGQGEGEDQGLHGLASVGDGCSSADGVDSSLEGSAPPPSAPPNMYLPTSWIRSMAGWVKTISSPGCSGSGSPPGCSAMKLSPSRPLVGMEAEVSPGSSW